jgi:hypothetical protein
LLFRSPAINAGNNSRARDPRTNLPLLFDQRGFDRIAGENVDIGAYEAFYSASPVMLSGRVTTSRARGLFNTRLTLDDTQGGILYTQTNSSGYYRFKNVVPGRTYILTAQHKYFQFDSPIFVTVDQGREDLNFFATK